jgi:hypothetical protein
MEKTQTLSDEMNEIDLQYCKKFGCRCLGEERYNGFCEEHKDER